jgi:tetratricopeptide (TPR) repeat protein
LKRSVTPALALCAVLAATGFTHPAAAQDSGGTAGRAFQAGTQAYARGDFRVAAASFDEAYRIAPRGAAAYNAGLSWEAAGEAARASDDYARALRAGDLGTVERADTTGRLRNLESNKVGRVSVFAPDDARVSLDGRDVTDAGRGLHVTPGSHALSIEFGDGKQESRSVRVAAGEIVEIRRTGHGEAAAPPAPPESSGSTSSDARAPTAAASEHIPAFVAFGGGVVASVLAIYFYERGLSARNDFVATNDHDPSLHDQAETFRTLTWVSWSAAAICAGVGAVLYFTETPASPSASPGAALEVGPRGVSLRVGF